MYFLEWRTVARYFGCFANEGNLEHTVPAKNQEALVILDCMPEGEQGAGEIVAGTMIQVYPRVPSYLPNFALP